MTQFYTAPTAIRALMRFGPDIISNYDLSSLRVLGSVGEPINPEAWRWYDEHVRASPSRFIQPFSILLSIRQGLSSAPLLNPCACFYLPCLAFLERDMISSGSAISSQVMVFHFILFCRTPWSEQVGKSKCHIVDTFWQTETGGHVMLPLANVTPTKPGSCSFPFFGIEVYCLVY